MHTYVSGMWCEVYNWCFKSAEPFWLKKNRRINQSIYMYYVWYFAIKIFTFINYYGLAIKFNILMFCLYTNLSVCCSLMTGSSFYFPGALFVLFKKGFTYPKKNQLMYH